MTRTLFSNRGFYLKRSDLSASEYTSQVNILLLILIELGYNCYRTPCNPYDISEFQDSSRVFGRTSSLEDFQTLGPSAYHCTAFTLTEILAEVCGLNVPTSVHVDLPSGDVAVVTKVNVTIGQLKIPMTKIDEIRNCVFRLEGMK